jgi:hypothetical protein
MALGCVQRLAHLLQRGTAKGKEEATAALWNLSTVNEQIKTAIVEAGALPSLVEMVCPPVNFKDRIETPAGFEGAYLKSRLNVKYPVEIPPAGGPRHAYGPRERRRLPVVHVRGERGDQGGVHGSGKQIRKKHRKKGSIPL